MTTGPIRVLILIGELGRGGAERQVHELATRMDPRRFHPIVATFQSGSHYQPLLESAGIEVIVLDKRGWREATLPLRLASLLRRRRVDVLHAFLFQANWRAVLAGRFAGARVICSLRSTGIWMNARHRLMERLTLPRADAVVVNAPAVREDMIRRVRVDPDRVRLIMNGVDTERFHPGVALQRGAIAGRNGRPGVVGFVGSLRDAKDPGLFLEIAQRISHRLPDTRFVLVGDGPLRGSLDAIVRESGLEDRVVFTGERSDIPEVLRSLDVLAVTSIREGCCNVILEAMATGVPVAATAVGGNPDLITHGVSGWLFPHGDADAGAEAVVSLLSGHDLAERVTVAGLARVRAEFSVETMVSRTSALYETLA